MGTVALEAVAVRAAQELAAAAPAAPAVLEAPAERQAFQVAMMVTTARTGLMGHLASSETEDRR